MKSPCVKECPDRLPCGACRKSCEAFREYEAQRLEVCKDRKMAHEIGG